MRQHVSSCLNLCVVVGRRFERTPRWAIYLFAVIVSLLTLWVRDVVSVSFNNRPLLIIQILPIVLSSLTGGLGPGLASTVICSLGVAYSGIPPVGHLNIAARHDLFQWLMLVVSGVLVSLLSGMLHVSIKWVQQEEAHLKQALDAQVEAKSAALAASKAKTEFLATMSHEIRTPLNGVLGMLQLVQTTDLTPEQLGYIHTAMQSGRSLLRVLSDVLDISKIEAKALNLVTECFLSNELFEPVASAFEDVARTKGLDFVCAVDPELPDVLQGDAGRIRQIIYNLVGNALKYTEAGEVVLEAFILPDGADAGRILLQLAVSDTGIGVPEEKVQNIFDAFTQVDGSYTRRFGGTGLGLAIVKKLVTLMDGNISFCSRLGLGTEVMVTLPLEVALEKQAPKAPNEPAADLVYRSLDVLLAEDDPINRLTVSHMLKKAGHRVHEVVNGVEAIAFLAVNPVDCVLMDVQMPEMDGVEATQRIRASELEASTRQVPVIALTAHAMKGDREQFLAAGMDGYISKPVDMDELERVLAEVVARRQD